MYGEYNSQLMTQLRIFFLGLATKTFILTFDPDLLRLYEMKVQRLIALLRYLN